MGWGSVLGGDGASDRPFQIQSQGVTTRKVLRNMNL